MTSSVRGFRLAVLPAFLVVLAAPVPPSDAADRFVDGRGGMDGTNDCLVTSAACKTVAHALAVASSGDTVKVAAGSYRVSLRFDVATTLTLSGGWDPAFVTRSPLLTPTVFKARSRRYPLGHDRRVCAVVATTGETIDLTLDGLTLTHGVALARSTAMGDPGTAGSQDGGGGLYVHAAGGTVHVTVRESAITGNKSKISIAGAVFVDAQLGGSADVTFDRTLISDNHAHYAAGIRVVGEAFVGGATDSLATVTLVNSIVAGNEAEGAAAISLLNATGPSGHVVLDLMSSTVTANHAMPGPEDTIDGALVLGPGTVANITNSILAGNTIVPAGPGQGQDLEVFGGGAAANVDHSDIRDAIIRDPGGTINDLGGNLSVDPQLVGFELATGSPLIDVGTCDTSEDFEGDPRPSGAGCDMGADEFQF